MSSHQNDNNCPSCQSRRQFLGSGLILGLGLILPSMSIAGGFRQMNGEVFVNGRSASSRTRIHAGSIIKTSANSSTSFVIGNNAFLLRPNSHVKFTPQGNSKLSISTLRLITGGLLSVFGPGPKKLLTNTATIGIRGTGVYMEAQEASSYVCLCYGKVDLSANVSVDKTEELETLHHKGKNIGKDGQIVDAGMANHTDDELVMLEDLVGRKVPF
jgi:hypothetical protein